MRYIAIREANSKEMFGIVEIPGGRYVRRVYMHGRPDTTTLGSEEISESQFTSFQALELAPTFSWVPAFDDLNSEQLADVYDPEFFFTDDEGVYSRG